MIYKKDSIFIRVYKMIVIYIYIYIYVYIVEYLYMSLSLILNKNDKVEHHIKIKTHKPINLRF